MCGIVGYKSKTNLNINDSALIKSILHRGPDSQNFYKIDKKNKIKNSLFLGFSRLAILDRKKRSNQPFLYKNLILCFNGEIYNFHKLKNELIKNFKINFETNSDTEVLIKLIFFYGLNKALSKMEGMWAFALYNKKNEELILCRDRFGEKPLLYYKEKNNFYFSSELPAFQIFLKNKFKVNKSYLKKYLFLDYRYLNKDFSSFYDKVEKVPQGSYIKIDKKFNFKISKYHKFLNQVENKISYKKTIQQTKKKLINLTKDSLISDRPLAFCLSGGIDSTGLVSLTKKYHNNKITCFTIYSDDKKYDEFETVDKTVRELKIKHKWVKINKDKTFNNLKKIIELRKYPILTVTSYIQWLMFQSISRNKIKVIISGNGSDEIFSGYYDHYLAYISDIYNKKDLRNLTISNWKNKIEPLIRNPLMKDYKNYKKNKNYLKIVKGSNSSSQFGLKKFNLEFKEKKLSKYYLKNRMINEMFYESVPVILQEEDINAMFFSMENRSPYLNSDLYKFIINSPISYFVRNGYAKSILRESLRNISPKHVLNKYEKIGFNISPVKLLDFKSKSILSFVKKKSSIYSIINKKKILDILNDKDMINKNSNFLFKFINAKILMDMKK